MKSANVKNIKVDSLLAKQSNKEEKESLSKLVHKYKRVFFQEGQFLTATSETKQKILTVPHNPVYCKKFRYPYALEEEINKQVKEMLENDIVRPSKSPYNSPLWVVPKKPDNSGNKKWRVVVDYRKLNSLTINDKYPMPNIESLFEKLGRSQYFSTIDLAKGFHQIPMDPVDVEKTAFSTENGHFEYTRMPFGLKNAPATFQRMINNVLHDYVNKICVIYMDDILIFSTSLTEHMESLEKIFKRLLNSNLKIQLDKCEFLSKQTKFLGHIITPEGIKPNEEKIQAIQKINVPTTVKQIKSFLGLTGYYRKFIRNYSMIAAPIIKFLKKNSKININDNAYIEAFEKLKRILTSPPLLSFPNFAKTFVVTTDASDISIGAVLSQEHKPISFASRTLNEHEKKYCTLEKELLAIVFAVQYFRPNLFGHRFVVQTDHQPLKWLYSLKEPNGRIFRWRMKLSEYEFDVEYIQGKENRVADFLSRIEIENNSKKEEEDIGIKSLFENSVDDVRSDTSSPTESERLAKINGKFQKSDFIINKYRTQIRLLHNKSKEFERLYNSGGQISPEG